MNEIQSFQCTLLAKQIFVEQGRLHLKHSLEDYKICHLRETLWKHIPNANIIMENEQLQKAQGNSHWATLQTEQAKMFL